GIGFGLFAPFFTRLMLAMPPAFIATLAGLAMMRVLQTAFVASFRDHSTLGALVCFLVTVADVPIFGIGAAFWGRVFGLLTTRVLERPARCRQDKLLLATPEFEQWGHPSRSRRLVCTEGRIRGAILHPPGKHIGSRRLSS
ncbi:MAG TPA: benzoate/H(+) symporter BenE family transporter, partial [Burkholderiales bacterium]